MELVERHGYSASLVSTGIEALELLDPTDARFVLVHPGLSDYPGIELARVWNMARSMSGDDPVKFIISGVSSEAVDFTHDGVTACLDYPIDSQKLIEILRTLTL